MTRDVLAKVEERVVSEEGMQSEAGGTNADFAASRSASERRPARIRPLAEPSPLLPRFY